MKFTQKIWLCVVLLAWSGIMKTEAQSAWATGSSGNWNTPGSWNPSGVPGVGNAVSITVGGTYTVTYDAPMSAASIASLVLGVTNSTPTLTLTAAGFNVIGTCVIPDNAAQVLNVNSGGIMNNGTLNMTSRAATANINSGGIITNSTTQVANNNSVDGNASLKIASGATASLGAVTIGRHTQSSTLGLNISGGTVTASSIDVGIRNSYANMVVSGGTLTNAGNLRLGTGTATAGREIRYNQTGGTVGCAGTVDLAISNNYTVWFSVLGASTTFSASGIRIYPNPISGTTARITNSGNIYLGASGLNILNSGTYTFAFNNQGVLGASADWSGNVNMVTPTSGTVTFKAADSTGTAHNITLTGVISGGADIAKTGGGLLSLNNANTYTGNTIISAGTLAVGNVGALPKGTGLTLGGSGTAGTLDLAGFNSQIAGLAAGSGAVTANQIITNSSAANTSTITFSNSAANATFGGVIAGGSKPIALTLLGGNLTLSGPNNYAGNIFISNSKLALSGSGSTFTGPSIVLSNPAAILDLTGMNNLSLGAGQSLGGYGSVTGSVTAVNCPITPGANGIGGTLTISGDLTLNGNVTNQFDLRLDPNATGGDQILVGGALNASGVNTILINLLEGSLSVGTYHLIQSGSAGSGDTNNFHLVGSPGAGLQAALAVTASGLDLQISPSGGAGRVWVGDGSTNLWDLTSANWLNNGFTDTFTNGNLVTFDDSSTNPVVNLVGALQPSAVTVDATTNYIFQGAGKITGTVSFTKTNSGMLTILTTNDYTGVTTIGQGTLQVGNGVVSGSLGSGSIVDGGSLLMMQPDNNTLGNAISGDGSLIQAGTATLILTGNNSFTGGLAINLGTLQIGSGGTPGNGNITNNAAMVFNSSGNNTVVGSISGPGTLALSGSGTVTLAALNSYSGNTTVGAGTLLVTGTNGPSAVAVNSGGKLGGSGTIGAAVTVNSGGTLAPGNLVGTLTITSNLTVNPGAILSFDLGTNSDRVAVTGNLNLSGTLNLNNAGGLGNGTYTLFTYGGSLTLSGLTLGTVPSGKLYQIDTTTPGQVNVIVGVIATNVPAFPGALGFGAIATGGRGGPVYHVTTLADSGPGSFRDAVSVSGRTIVFDVGGYISLASAVSAKGNLTIAGQTAPGGGIGFEGGEISFAGSANIICRFVRIRPGSATASSTDDALSLYQAKNVIVDHCSIEFAPWNNIDGVGDSTHVITNITIMNTLIADPTGQQFGCHSESVGGTWSWFYNIFANSHNRNPLAKVNTVFINNVLYNCSAGYTTHTSTPFKHDLVNNYFISGPASSGGDFPWFQIDNNQSMYFTGNLFDGDQNSTLNGGSTVPLPGYQGGGTILGAPWSIWPTNVPVYTPASAFRRNLSLVGAWPHDLMDSLILDQVKTLGNGSTGTGAGTAGPDGGLYTSQAQTGLPNNGYGTITGGPAPVDSDGDGMPDFWETAVGLNPNQSTDTTNLTLSGYTQLEIYLNWLAGPHAVVGINTNLDIDLAQYANGFTNISPVYSISNVINGTVTLLPDGHTARFLPATNFTGTASFNFKVTGNDGTLMTNSVGLVVSGTAPAQELVWHGNGVANVWDLATTADWFNGATPSVFHTGDAVTFDDTGSNIPAIYLASALSPGLLTVAASNNYTFGGVCSLGGSVSLTKSGPGTLTLNTSNTYSGGTLINGGTVVLGVPGAASSGGVTLGGGGLQLAGGNFGNLVAIAGTGAVIGNNAANDTLQGAISGTGTWTINVASGQVVTEESDNSGFVGTIALAGTGVYRLSQGGFAWGNSNCVFDLGSGGTLNNRAVAATNIYLGALTGGIGSQLRGSDQSGSFTNTLMVGYLNLDSTFNGTLSDGTGAPAQKLALVKLGTGTLTLNGTNTDSGAITVNSGALMINGVSGSGVVNAAGGLLGGAGLLGGDLAVQPGVILAPGAVSGSAGTLSVANNLTLNGAILRFDLSNVTTPGNGVNDLISLNGGSVNLSGISTIVPNYLNGPLTSGTYTLIAGGASTSGSAANLAWGGVAGTRQIFAFDISTPGTVQLQVSGLPPMALVWQGTNGNNWDLTTTNWLNSGVADRFFNLDPVLFDDTSTNGNVAIFGTLQPGAITVSNAALAYTFNGGIAGATVLQKFGAGSLTLTGSNSFGGGTIIHGGSITLSNDVANQSGLGAGPVTFDGGTLSMYSDPSTTNSASWNLIVPSSGRLNADATCDLFGTLSGAGTLNLFVPATHTTIDGDWSAFTGRINVFTGTNGDFRLASLSGFPSAAISLSNNISAYVTVDPGADGVPMDLGELSGTSTARLMGAATANTLIWRIGGRNTDATFAGTITEQSTNATTAIQKIGTGTWTLTGSNSYAGDTTVAGGALLVNNTAGSGTGQGDVVVATGATLGGNGAIAGFLTIQSGATLTPGNPVGTLSVSNDLLLDGAAVLNFDLGAIATSYKVVVGNNLVLGGILNLTNVAGFGAGTYTLMTYGGTLSGTLPVIGSKPAGYNVTVDTSIAGQVRLVVRVPVPVFGNVVLANGNLVFSGSSGPATMPYYVLTSTNLTLPVTNWMRLLTNYFDAGGNFNVTNPVDPGLDQSYFLLQLP